MKLNIQFDEQKIVDGLQPYNEHWVPYNAKKDVVNNRWGLPITSNSGKVSDNMHLNSFGYMRESLGIELTEDNFNTPTEVYHNCDEIKRLVDIFSPDIGRVHMLRVDQGGFFPPHRDFKGIAPEYFRLTCVLGSCTDFNYVLNIDDKQFRHERGHLYFVNYQKNHNLFSFSNNLYIMILTVKLNQRTHDLVIHHSMSR
jgi:hypothetical protein